jgi:transcriptional regulator with XRE-family HTH domain
MNQINQDIGQRLRAVRELAELDAQAFAAQIGIAAAELLQYEAGEADIPVSVLHNAAQAFGVSTTELMTGEAARLHQYSVVRAGKGVAVERRAAYGYQSLAYNFAGRAMEPMLITIQPGEPGTPIHRTAHPGQEFHYCLEGTFDIEIGGHRITMGAGDSVYFDSSCPHGMQALHGRPARALVIITA